MADNLSNWINRHQYPALFKRFPRLLWIEHALDFLMYLRTWVIRRELKQSLGLLRRPFRLVDAGCGSGQYLIKPAKRYRDSLFFGIDTSSTALDMLAKQFAPEEGQRIHLIQGRLGAIEIPHADVICCFSVLPYIDDDVALLNQFASSLNEDGQLMMYLPLPAKRVIPGYVSLRSKVFANVDYDKVNKIKHIYTLDSIRQTLANAGLQLVRYRHSYGFLGSLAYEIMTLALYTMQRMPWFLTIPLLLIYGLGIHPIMLLFMLIDYVAPKKSGNGLFLKAVKRTGG